MKKKIFITGAVREYDSSNPKQFADSIADFIKANLVNVNSANNVNVLTSEPDPSKLLIIFPFSTGDTITPDTISNPLYRCFFGDCESFRPAHSLDYRMSFGPSFLINWRVGIDEIKKAHRENTKFYKADRYKSLDIIETDSGLAVTFQF